MHHNECHIKCRKVGSGDPITEKSKLETHDRDFVNTRLLFHKHVKISVDEWILETTRPQKHVKFLDQYTGQERLIRSHSLARFCFELSGNSN